MQSHIRQTHHSVSIVTQRGIRRLDPICCTCSVVQSASEFRLPISGLFLSGASSTGRTDGQARRTLGGSGKRQEQQERAATRKFNYNNDKFVTFFICVQSSEEEEESDTDWQAETLLFMFMQKVIMITVFPKMCDVQWAILSHRISQALRVCVCVSSSASAGPLSWPGLPSGPGRIASWSSARLRGPCAAHSR